MKKGNQYGKNQWKVTLLNLGVRLGILAILAGGVWKAWPYAAPRVSAWLEEKKNKDDGETEEETFPEGGRLSVAMMETLEETEFPRKAHTYKFVPSDGTWNDAAKAAREDGGYLADITSAEEQQEIEMLMEGYDGYSVIWLGANRLAGDFAWMSGEPWDYTNWAEGEPNNETGSESYLMMYRSDGKWGWNDAEVSVSEYYQGHMGYLIEYGD